MSDRLKDLQRQRALAQEQLAWLDREIARETGQPAPAAPPPPAVTPVAAPAAAESARVAEEILAQYQQAGQLSVKEARRGCYVYFFLALGALAVIAVGGYYLYLYFRG